MDILKTALIGIAIGMANVIPGVSGGTLAVVFGIYDRFINAITYNVKKLWANRRFVVPIFLGMLFGVLLFSKMITALYGRFPIQTDYFFTGLIIGSIPMLFIYMVKEPSQDDADGTERKTIGAAKIVGIVICAVAGLALILLFNYLEEKFSGPREKLGNLPPLSVPLAGRIFFAGLVGAVAMVVPGISGSLLMLILGVYPIVITSIPALLNPETTVHAFFLLLPNGIGVLIGLICGAKLIAWLLRKFPNHTYAVIFGLICGSFFAIFPGVNSFDGALMAVASFVCLALGAALSYFTSRFSKA
ncbi:MAG: DUF368 domain-containing protein [Treponema sp.]|nr:DUF368 domain-containing protein [Treponema sp.]